MQTQRKTLERVALMLGGRIRYNVLRMTVEVLVGDEWTEWDSNNYLLFPDGWGGKDAINDAVAFLAMQEKYDPVAEHLGLIHQQVQPFEGSYSELILGAHDPLYEVYLRKWFASLVARVYSPGCKCDTVLTLLGAQGVGKSTFFRLIGGEFFGDSVSSGGRLEKDDLMVFHQHWLVEWAELGRVLREDRVEIVKSFLSRTEDCFRPPYGRHVVRFPRRFVVCASTNLSNCLPDVTGNRRFWVIEADKIFLNDVAANRDRFLSAAMRYVLHGGEWWLSQEEQAMSDERNRDYFADDFLQGLELLLVGMNEVTTPDLVAQLGMPKGKKSERQIAQALRTLGWKQEIKRVANGIRRVWMR